MRRATDIVQHFSPSCIFQSTLSMRRATKMDINVNLTAKISIHALHEESDGVVQSSAFDR